MNIISLEAVSKSYGVKPLFENITFGIDEGQKIGLIGVNGTGKSTFLKVIAGLIPPDQGRIAVGNRMRIQYLSQTPEIADDITVLDYVYAEETKEMKLVHQYVQALYQLEQDPTSEKWQKTLHDLIPQMDAADAWDLETNAKAILTRLGITMFDQFLSQLSGGQKKRVAMARVLIHPADLLILDEPTNHIDHETVEWLEDYLSRYKGALLLITHDRYFLDRVVNRIIELDDAKLYFYQGNYSQFLEQKELRLEQLASSESKRQNLLRRELAWLRRGAKARSTKQKARIERVQELQGKGYQFKNEQIDLAPLGTQRLGKKVMVIEDLTKKLENRYLIKDFNYIVLPDERLGIIGPNGSGKSTLLNMIAGKLDPDTGYIDRGETVKIGYYDQESMNLDPSMKVIDYIKEAAEVIHGTDGSVITASQMLERFLFPPSIQWGMISRLSGGEKRRLYLLRILMESPNVLLLDEPTNDLDIQTLTILEDYLEHFPGAVIVVSHDRYFLDRTVDHLFSLEKNGLMVHYNGSYSEYLEQKKLALETEKNDRKEQQNASPPQKKVDRVRKMTYKEQQEFSKIEQRIAELEERNAQLVREIEQAGSDYQLLRSHSEEQQQIGQELDERLERWAELSELMGE
ncbi:MAG TPA: ABC-F family ATP-binding cassette domain-containing protein [Bacillota bacterium]|nr:ABC-F family ATP-binding cassette domain-containing protein [Bacillota bacterium]